MKERQKTRNMKDPLIHVEKNYIFDEIRIISTRSKQSNLGLVTYPKNSKIRIFNLETKELMISAYSWEFNLFSEYFNKDYLADGYIMLQ